MSIIIPARYNGPDGSGNGGYCCGVFAAELAKSLPHDDSEGEGESESLDINSASAMDYAIEVTLRAAPPLDTPLSAELSEDQLSIIDGQTLVASAKRCSLDLTIPAAPSLNDATVASSHCTGLHYHPFPHCFVCGPQRLIGDGLRIFAGDLNAEYLDAKYPPSVAANWRPYQALGGDDGYVKEEYIWAALDCPSYFGAAIEDPDSVDKPRPPAVLGRLSVQIFKRQIAVEQDYMISSWPIASQGRKLQSGVALFDVQGECLAVAKAVWIRLQS